MPRFLEEKNIYKYLAIYYKFLSWTWGQPKLGSQYRYKGRVLCCDIPVPLEDKINTSPGTL